MSKAKPWPTAANRHRLDSIFYAGEVVIQAEIAQELSAQLRQAIAATDIALALAITQAIDARLAAITKTANLINLTLENAPSSLGE